MVIKKGKVDISVVFNLKNVMIPTLKEEPIKYLGQWCNNTLRHTENGKNTVIQLREYLVKIDKSQFQGKFKA
jgi:hypothetical protein